MPLDTIERFLSVMGQPQSQMTAQEGICGTTGQERFGDSHIWGRHERQPKGREGTWANEFVPLSSSFNDSLEMTPVCATVSQSMISVCFHLNKEVH